MNNKNELLNVLNNLVYSKDNIILIDGSWGSGKTYLINEFIKNYCKTPIFYVSMLGKVDVDDINTSLYMEVFKDDKITSKISSSINPIRLKFNSELDLDYILKKKIEGNSIIIFDDFERYASSDYKMFLSYVSNLILAGAKIVVISNLEALGSGELYNFNEVKEKIFDHIYVAKLFNNDVLKEKYKDIYTLLDKEEISYLNSNFRIADKVLMYLNNLKEKNVILNKKIVYFSILVISLFYNENVVPASSFKIRISEDENKKILKLFEYKKDLYYWEFLKIYENLLNKDISYNLSKNLDLILKIYKSYIYNDYSNF